jgi:hypothetical protein
VIEHLPSKHKVMSSNSSTTTKKTQSECAVKTLKEEDTC